MEGTAEMSERGGEKVFLLDISIGMDMGDERLCLPAILLFSWGFPHI